MLQQLNQQPRNCYVPKHKKLHGHVITSGSNLLKAAVDAEALAASLEAGGGVYEGGSATDRTFARGGGGGEAVLEENSENEYDEEGDDPGGGGGEENDDPAYIAYLHQQQQQQQHHAHASFLAAQHAASLGRDRYGETPYPFPFPQHD